ncbi:hypothetical protein ACS5PU_08075 [Pedobacter sp. GSP4]|uniref:hypothetical protein n=1 Tax=Pedobacter sp. GSP4 TaxID=3453716 RepID=UPI003EE9FCAE
METDLIISAINQLHQKANQALENKDTEVHVYLLDDSFTYSPAEGVAVNKRDYIIDMKKYLKGLKSFQTSYYRIKSNVEDGIFTEKIARKSVVIKPNLLLFAKKETIQTEEVFNWKNIKGEWKIISVEITLEEKY